MNSLLVLLKAIILSSLPHENIRNRKIFGIFQGVGKECRSLSKIFSFDGEYCFLTLHIYTCSPYSERFQTSGIEHFAKIDDVFEPSTIFANPSILNV